MPQPHNAVSDHVEQDNVATLFCNHLIISCDEPWILVVARFNLIRRCRVDDDDDDDDETASSKQPRQQLLLPANDDAWDCADAHAVWSFMAGEQRLLRQASTVRVKLLLQRGEQEEERSLVTKDLPFSQRSREHFVFLPKT